MAMPRGKSKEKIKLIMFKKRLYLTLTWDWSYLILRIAVLVDHAKKNTGSITKLTTHRAPRVLRQNHSKNQEIKKHL